jgi:hypothetical protein
MAPPEPQHQTVPSAAIAQVAPEPAAIADTPVSPSAPTGSGESSIVPLPSWPPVFSPQQRTRPLASNAQLWARPETSAVAPEIPETVTGRGDETIEPSPSWPAPLLPQQRTEPATRAQLNASPADSPVAAPPRSTTSIGDSMNRKSPLLPLPSWPALLSPQQATRPAAKIAQPLRSPGASCTAPASAAAGLGVREGGTPEAGPIAGAPQQAVTPPRTRAQVLRDDPTTRLAPARPATTAGVE